MRTLLPLGLLALAVPTVAHAQSASSPAPIRAWMGLQGALLTNFSAIGGAGDYRFMIERLGGPSAGVALGTIGIGSDPDGDGAGAAGYGALLAGKSFEIGDAAFANASVGVGYGQGSTEECSTVNQGGYTFEQCNSEDARGLIVPVRLEVHVASSSRMSFGASITGAAYSPIGSAIGIGLHLNLGRNLRGDR